MRVAKRNGKKAEQDRVAQIEKAVKADIDLDKIHELQVDLANTIESIVTGRLAKLRQILQVWPTYTVAEATRPWDDCNPLHIPKEREGVVLAASSSSAICFDKDIGLYDAELGFCKSHGRGYPDPRKARPLTESCWNEKYYRIISKIIELEIEYMEQQT